MDATATPLDVLTLLADGDWTAATDAARRAATERPDSRLAAALSNYLGELSSPGVYDEPSAFEAFIGGGGNVELYRRTIDRLATLHHDVAPRAILDIGCGDGRVTAGALDPATTRVDLVEPSAELLDHAIAAVARPGVEVVGHRCEIGEFVAGAGADLRWDLTQSTFAMHATAPADRPTVFAALASRTTVLAIVDFDVPAFDDRSREHLAYLADRYEVGLAEYDDLPEVVPGFLLPVLVGQLDPTRPRYTFEQPLEKWAELATDAGFTTTTEIVAPHWWADAGLVLARTP